MQLVYMHLCKNYDSEKLSPMTQGKTFCKITSVPYDPGQNFSQNGLFVPYDPVPYDPGPLYILWHSFGIYPWL